MVWDIGLAALASDAGACRYWRQPTRTDRAPLCFARLVCWAGPRMRGAGARTPLDGDTGTMPGAIQLSGPGSRRI